MFRSWSNQSESMSSFDARANKLSVSERSVLGNHWSCNPPAPEVATCREGVSRWTILPTSPIANKERWVIRCLTTTDRVQRYQALLVVLRSHHCKCGLRIGEGYGDFVADVSPVDLSQLIRLRIEYHEVRNWILVFNWRQWMCKVCRTSLSYSSKAIRVINVKRSEVGSMLGKFGINWHWCPVVSFALPKP
jgi:hypothetical protein